MRDAVNVLASALVGTVLGWGANALQLGGRVTAIEQALSRIESRLDNFTGAHHGQETTHAAPRQ